jgi:hypothetical protein
MSKTLGSISTTVKTSIKNETPNPKTLTRLIKQIHRKLKHI